MKITIHSPKFDVTDSINSHINHCADKLEKYNSDNHPIEIKITIGKTNKTYSVLVVGGKYNANSTSDDLYSAITSSFDHIETCFETEKSKFISGRKKQKPNFEELE